jgi:hypothetical protein
MSDMTVGCRLVQPDDRRPAMRFPATTLAAAAMAAWAALTIVVPLQVRAETVSFDGVSFDAPEGFRPLTREEIAIKYPRAGAPDFVLGNIDPKGNIDATTSIAYGFREIPIREDQLDDAKNDIEKTFEKMIPGLQWNERKLIEINDKRWIYLELSSAAIGTDIHNIILATSYQGKLLVFNFNSTKEEFPSVEAALRKSIASITLK